MSDKEWYMVLQTPIKSSLVTETMTQTTTSDPTVDLKQNPGSMTIPDESLPKEVRNATDSLLGPKAKIRIGTWNVRTMNDTSKLAQVINEMQRRKLDILRMSECRWTGSGKQTSNGGSDILCFCHKEQHIQGVSIVMSKSKVNTLLGWEPVSERLIRAHFNLKYCKLTILQCYAPTNDASDEIKDDWYEQLKQATAKVPQHDMLLIMGDMNTKVGEHKMIYEGAMGRQGCGQMNNNGMQVANLCLANSCVIGGTIFPHKQIHKLTWSSPDGSTINQIDDIVINGRWRRSLQDVKVYRAADFFSDHYLVTANIKLKLKKANDKITYWKHVYCQTESTN